MRVAVRVAAVVALLVAVALALTQVEVSDPELESARVCGSAFDVMTDRVDWQDWWARDLDEPRDAAREALPRTRQCPDALNTRTVWVVVLGGLGIAGLVATGFRRRLGGPDRPRPAELRRLGTITLATGMALSAAGIAAIIVLTADAESTLFLYVDRLVVGLIGLIVLVPAAAIMVLGQALRILGREADVAEAEVPDA